MMEKQYVDLLEKSNIYCKKFPYFVRNMGKVKRWQLPINVKTGGDERAANALNVVEQHLGKIFDRKEIAEKDDGDIRSGIIFARGGAVIDWDYARDRKLKPPEIRKKFTGNVSRGPGEGEFPDNFMSEDGLINCRLYVNLDNNLGGIASEEVAIHELGHAMGLGDHFKGFGEGSRPIGPNFWSVLKLLYELPIGEYRAK